MKNSKRRLTGMIIATLLSVSVSCNISLFQEIEVNVFETARENAQIAEQVSIKVITEDLEPMMEAIPGINRERIQDIQFKVITKNTADPNAPVSIKITLPTDGWDSQELQVKVLEFLKERTEKRLENYRQSKTH